jgi:hypothetical protein
MDVQLDLTPDEIRILARPDIRRYPSVTQKIIRANARDVVIMILAAWAEVGAMYVGPFCVKRIL